MAGLSSRQSSTHERNPSPSASTLHVTFAATTISGGLTAQAESLQLVASNPLSPQAPSRHCVSGVLVVRGRFPRSVRMRTAVSGPLGKVTLVVTIGVLGAGMIGPGVQVNVAGSGAGEVVGAVSTM